MHGRLFFGFEYSFERTVHVVALDPTGRPLLRVCFPLHDRCDTDLETGAAAEIATALVAFAEAHDALPVCGTDEEPPVLAALARRLGGTARYVSAFELERTALPGVPPHREPGCAAHQRALLAGLAAAEGLGDVGLGEDL
jgi:hypothetical protein